MVPIMPTKNLGAGYADIWALCDGCKKLSKGIGSGSTIVMQQPEPLTLALGFKF
jgi:hypothetical protein